VLGLLLIILYDLVFPPEPIPWPRVNHTLGLDTRPSAEPSHCRSVAIAITLVNVVYSLVLAIHPSTGGIFFGYITSPATWAYGPIVISWLNEYFSALPDERAILLGMGQTLGAVFVTWVPLLVFNTGTQAPLFQTGYVLCAVVGVAQVLGLLGMWRLSRARLLIAKATTTVLE
jgi:hypothetical protein